MKNRLKTLLYELGMTASRLADEINVQRSGISHILSGRNQPSWDFLVKVLTRFPDINPDWLILGNGPVFRNKNTGNDSANTSLNSNTTNKIIKDLQFEKENPLPQRVTNVTSIKGVIVLHPDGGFDFYHPAKEG